jgi:threonylcarbamoyladenosine tRNA methylthiotransferase MtaB
MRVCFTNLGCKLNQAEIESLARDFLAAGHEVVGSLDEADLHVVNSCTVTHVAARSSRKAAGRGRQWGLRTVLTGCWATEQAEEAARLAGVDLVVPNAEKERLLERVHEVFGSEGTQVPVPWVRLPFGHTRALVKVEDGCNMRCAFCIIPSTRGRQRSRPLPEVVAEVRSMVAAGYGEVVVTGVQISAYSWQGSRLFELVEALLRETAVPRLRLTSIAPWDLDERLLGLWSDPRLCRHLHLSLQSGSTATLRRMRRPYTAESYARLLEQVRAAVPGVGITTDVITGFPGETREEFEESLALVARAGFAKVHVFPFSSRPGTEAATLPGQVSPEEKKERTERMLAVAEDAERAFHRAFLGTRQTVLWERPRDGGMGQGYTDNYIRVFSEAGAGLFRSFSEVELAGLAQGGVVGTLYNPRPKLQIKDGACGSA